MLDFVQFRVMALWVMPLVFNNVGAAGAGGGGTSLVVALVCAGLDSPPLLPATTCKVYAVDADKLVKV